MAFFTGWRFAIGAALLIGSMAILPGAFAQNTGNSLALVYEDGAGNTLPYRLFLPPNHDAPGAEYPLVLHLHGAGERGTNNTSQLLYIDGLIAETQTEHPAFLLVPQAAPGRRWDAFGSNDVSLSGQMVLDVIDLLETQYQVDSSRRYATGLSLGGFGTWDLIGKRPEVFSTAFPLSGYGETSRADEYLDTRIWTFHGGGDTVVPVIPKRETVEAIRQAGGDPIYTEVLGGHGIWRPVYDDPIGELYDWVFDGVEPAIAEWEYDPATGDVRIDAGKAPGGSIDILNFSVNQLDLLTLPETIKIDGVAMPAADVLRVSRISLDYNARTTGGFSGVMEIPGLLPEGLDFLSLSAVTSRQFYFSPETGDNRRFFSLTTRVIPEPTALALVSLLVLGTAGRRGRTVAS